ncbi:uncharacterized protein LOC118457964 [Anopheles albimanus]|uniref:uncharacterized protein LOC118457964 n=1 Tax=Anopheles albimanus TaxID=7167 RepID=UPI00163F0FAA|nr:uncharacterized protein LOC118457964 [Anopheles albimanus]
MLIHNLFCNINGVKNKESSQSYECLLNLASDISEFQAKNMLLLAVKSNMIEFSKCLIKRYNIDIFDHKNRSILHLAIENGHDGIVHCILAKKLGLNNLDEIAQLKVDSIPNLTFCYRAIREIMQSVGEKWWCNEILCLLAKQIAKLSLIHPYGANCGYLLLQSDAKELYQMAIKCRFLFLVYYLQREFPSAIPPWIYDAHWLACIAETLKSSDLADVTKWLMNSNEVDKDDDFFEVVEKCDTEKWDLTSINLEELIHQVNANILVYESEEDVCKMKLVVLAVCLKQESTVRLLCETLNVSIDRKILFNIMEIAHHATDRCEFHESDFDPIYKYLFKHAGNLNEIDADGRNMLHLVVESGPSCMAMFLIKHNMFNVMTTNGKNGWNIFHYYASRKGSIGCCCTEKEALLPYITKQVLEITSDDDETQHFGGRSDFFTENIVYYNDLESAKFMHITESGKSNFNELCFNSKGGRKSAIHVAVEAGNIDSVGYMICLRLGMLPSYRRILPQYLFRLGIVLISCYYIWNAEEYSRCRKCYDVLYEAALQFPFNTKCDYLLHNLMKLINRFSPQNMQPITEQESEEDHVEQACRTAIRYRSLSKLEHLIIVYEHQTNQSLARSNCNELLASMMECIRRNKISLFKLLASHYRNLQGIHPGVKVQYRKEENDNDGSLIPMIDEDVIRWSVIDHAMDRDYLSLFILSVAYGRLLMVQYLNEIRELAVNKSLILLIMKALDEGVPGFYTEAVVQVYKYLSSISEGNTNLLHLCVHGGNHHLARYLMEKKIHDPKEIDLENGWNAGHYCVSEPASNVKLSSDLFELITENMDCFGVYDRKGRSIVHLALENGYSEIAEHLIKNRLGMVDGRQPWHEWDLKEIETHIEKLEQIMASLPSNLLSVLQVMYEKEKDREIALTTYYQLFE